MKIEDLIKQEVSAQFEVTVGALESKSREHPLTDARQIAMTLCYSLTTTTQEKVGKIFGGRNHATINYAINQVIGHYETEKDYRSNVNIILHRISLKSDRAFTFENVLNCRDVALRHKENHIDNFQAKIKELMEAQNPTLILMIVQEMKEINNLIIG